MNRIDDLIRDLCPDGVEYKLLSELVEIFSGHAFDSTYFNKTKTGLPLIRIRDINSGFSETYYSGPYQNQYITNNGDLLIGMDGNFRVVCWNQGEALLNQRVCRLQNVDPRLDKRFLYHIMTPALSKMQDGNTKSTVNHLSIKRLRSVQIPLPPFEIQQEIAKTLDQFTQLKLELEMELEAELEARQQQYTHYRRLLIAKASQDAPLVSLHDLGTWHGGITPSKKRAEFWNSPDIHWLTPKDMSSETVTSTIDHVSYQALTETPLKHLPENCVAFVFRSNILRRKLPIAIIQPRVTLNQDMRALVTLNDISANYVAEVCLAQQDLLRSRFVRTDGSMAAVESKALFNHKIPVPPLREQEQIADQLAAFRSIYTDLTSSLTTEIEACRKQYEYYRNRLLTFPEKK